MGREGEGAGMHGLTDNSDLADVLDRVGELLEAQNANQYRVRAYRHAAESLRKSPRAVADVLATEGVRGLFELPAIGKTIAEAIRELVETGHLRYLHRLEGEVTPERLLMTVPGIGTDTAHRIHEELGVETLEELELAAHDGRLARVRGFGERRVRAIRDVLGSMLSRSSRRHARRIGEDAVPDEPVPDVSTLLAVDQDYGVGVDVGALPRIAPRRFNPTGEAWLPILHTDRDGWHFTALFSNTARAYELHATRDWVVLYHERDGHEGRCTVVTETHGPLSGRRVVRGREEECAALYARSVTAA
jgi:DNA polymerase (family 10)